MDGDLFWCPPPRLQSTTLLYADYDDGVLQREEEEDNVINLRFVVALTKVTKRIYGKERFVQQRSPSCSREEEEER